jgi:hypothetical protein
MSQSHSRQHTDADSQHSTRKQSQETGLQPEILVGLNAHQRSLIQLQRTIGNAAVQRLLATQPPMIQRQDLSQFGLGSPNAESPSSEGEPAPAEQPTTQADTSNQERLTSDEWLSRVKNPQIAVQSPMIIFTVGDTSAGFPTTSVQAFDFSATAQ